MSLRLQLNTSSLALALAIVLSPASAAQQAPLQAQDIADLVQAQAAEAVSVSVFATGLYNPRGLKFGPDGNLYVAEGGKGGTQSTASHCAQVIPPIGPYTGSGVGGRISKITPLGTRSTVTSKLPSSQTSAPTGSLTSGVADIAFIGNTMYALIGGAGCSHGVLGRDNAVVRISSTGVPTLVANLSAFQKSHPVASPEMDDFEPDGTWWSMVVAGGNLYAVEPNHGELDRINPTTGTIHRVADISATQGHSVPTALSAFYGNFFVGNLGTFPVMKGSSKVLKITPTGTVTTAVNGLTTVLSVQFDKLGRMYVLQTTDGSTAQPSPGTGSVVRIANGVPLTIVSGLTTPTGMVFGPDGALYVSNVGFGAPPTGLGQILRIKMGN